MVININTGEGGKSIQQQVKEKVEVNPVLKISSVASVDQNFLKKLDLLENKRKSAPPAMPTMLSMLQRNSNGELSIGKGSVDSWLVITLFEYDRNATQ
jgi:hypothetical protein